MKSAQQSATKFVERAGAASSDYAQGVQTTTKDQAARAIAAKEIHKQATMEALNRDAYAKGLQKSGQQGWKEGVAKKGVNRYAEGVSVSAGKYATNSAPYDGARGAADNLPKGLKGSAASLARVKAVMDAQRAIKISR